MLRRSASSQYRRAACRRLPFFRCDGVQGKQVTGNGRWEWHPAVLLRVLLWTWTSALNLQPTLTTFSLYDYTGGEGKGRAQPPTCLGTITYPLRAFFDRLPLYLLVVLGWACLCPQCLDMPRAARRRGCVWGGRGGGTSTAAVVRHHHTPQLRAVPSLSGARRFVGVSCTTSSSHRTHQLFRVLPVSVVVPPDDAGLQYMFADLQTPPPAVHVPWLSCHRQHQNAGQLFWVVATRARASPHRLIIVQH